MNNFGVHLTIDGYGGSFDKLNNMELIWESLDKLPERLKMRKLHPPYVVKVGPQNPKDDGGFSGFVMIAESHISVHAFPYRGFVSIDVYTCQSAIDQETCLQYFKDAFDLKDMETNVVPRGQRFEELAKKIEFNDRKNLGLLQTNEVFI